MSHPLALWSELTTWLKVMTLRRVSLQLFTMPSGKQGSRSFSSVSMCSVVVASLEPGQQRGAETPAHSLQPALPSPAAPHPALSQAPTSGLLNLLDAKLGGGNGSRVMGRGLLSKHEFTALEDRAHSMLGSLPDLRGKARGSRQGQHSTSSVGGQHNSPPAISVCTPPAWPLLCLPMRHTSAPIPTLLLTHQMAPSKQLNLWAAVSSCSQQRFIHSFDRQQIQVCTKPSLFSVLAVW